MGAAGWGPPSEKLTRNSVAVEREDFMLLVQNRKGKTGVTIKVDSPVAVEKEFRKRTPKSAELMQRSAHSMPGGLTRGFGFHWPYPAVMERGQGCHLWDVDGNRYIDLASNGLALIHGHAFRPVIDA